MLAHLVYEPSAEEMSASEHTIAILLARVVFTATVLVATAESGPAHTLGFRRGSPSVTSAIGWLRP